MNVVASHYIAGQKGPNFLPPCLYCLQRKTNSNTGYMVFDITWELCIIGVHAFLCCQWATFLLSWHCTKIYFRWRKLKMISERAFCSTYIKESEMSCYLQWYEPSLFLNLCNISVHNPITQSEWIGSFCDGNPLTPNNKYGESLESSLRFSRSQQKSSSNVIKTQIWTGNTSPRRR